MYEDTTYEVILQRMLSRVPDKFDKREGSVIWDTHSPTAIEFQILYMELNYLKRFFQYFQFLKMDKLLLKQINLSLKYLKYNLY